MSAPALRRAALALLLPLLLARAGSTAAAPPCTPYQPPTGRWGFPADGSLQWEAAPPPAPNATAGGGGAPCAWSTPTLRALAQCMPGATLVFGGDSVVRYMVTTLGLEAWGCGQGGGAEDAQQEAACSALYGLKERKGDAVVVTPPAWGAQNLTLHFRYLRFGYEFLDRAGAWQPDHLGLPGAADGILLGGMGYWDARYRTHDTLLNILQRLGEDMAPLFARNPSLRRKLTVLSTTYSENFDGRMGMFPHDILDAINAAAAPVWRAMRVPWFDVTRYVRAVGAGAASQDLAGRMAASGGKLLTQDGYHPRVEVQRVILQEVFSHMCEAHRRRAAAAAAGVSEEEEEAAAAAAAAGAAGAAARVADRLVSGPLAAQGWGGSGSGGSGALGAGEAAGGAALALLSCCACLSQRGRRCRRRGCTTVGLRCGCLK